MSREDIQKLLGGYATDTLSEAERRALYAAALEDQELFDALAKEQALREVLQDPAARQQLMEALGPAPVALMARGWRWLRRPAVLAMAGGMAVLLIVAGLALRQPKHAAQQEALVADAITQTPPTPVKPAAVAAEPTARPVRKTLKQTLAGALESKAEQAPPWPAPTAIGAPPAQPAPAAPRPAPAGVGGQLGGGGGGDVRPAVQAAGAPVVSLNSQAMPPASLMHARNAFAAGSFMATPAVQYTLLRRGDGDTYSPVPSGTVFHAGDSVRLRIEPAEDGNVRLFQREPGAGWNLVASQQVEKDQRYDLPSTGGLQSDRPAKLELLLELSRLAQATPATAAGAAASAPAAKALAPVKITLDYQ
ncbi:MAG: hypothetical protein ABSF64_09040 [Bryobacteraceae bacterium]|jgi:hypothetical protein